MTTIAQLARMASTTAMRSACEWLHQHGHSDAAKADVERLRECLCEAVLSELDTALLIGAIAAFDCDRPDIGVATSFRSVMTLAGVVAAKKFASVRPTPNTETRP